LTEKAILSHRCRGSPDPAATSFVARRSEPDWFDEPPTNTYYLEAYIIVEVPGKGGTGGLGREKQELESGGPADGAEAEPAAPDGKRPEVDAVPGAGAAGGDAAATEAD
jgi:hypothetical protein